MNQVPINESSLTTKKSFLSFSVSMIIIIDIVFFCSVGLENSEDLKKDLEQALSGLS